tara:strand:+ start:1748 stop:2308 length:561 start_codon:yes stop_codon:yes gene_type:complete
MAKRRTKSSTKRQPQTQDVGAGLVDEEEVQSAPTTTGTSKETSHMAEDYNEDESIVEFSEDISEAEPPEPLPAKEYPAEIMGAVVKMSQNATRYIATQVRIDPADYPADYNADLNPDGITIMQPVGAEDNQKARFRLRRTCETLGVTVPGRTLDVSDWLGVKCRVELKIEPFEGIMQNKIARFVAL